MIRIDDKLLSSVTLQAKYSTRKRKNFNFHHESTDLLQRMLNAMEPGTYVRPHKHSNPDKREVFIILSGKMLVVEFSEEGKIISHIVLDRQLGNYGIEIPPGTYHTVISLETGSVVYEIKDGPYEVTIDKGFASWAPMEGTPEGEHFIKDITKLLNVNPSVVK